jgi:hypothetical protein
VSSWTKLLDSILWQSQHGGNFTQVSKLEKGMCSNMGKQNEVTKTSVDISLLLCRNTEFSW